MSYDCIIIGAGPAGLMAGNFLKGVHALVLEGEEKPAQKLLLSGGGQCNFTHDGPIEGFYDKFGDRGRFVRKALCGFTNADVMDYMTSRGVPPHVREDGKVFPKSMDAWDVFRALRKGLESNEISLLKNQKVVDIDKTDQGYQVVTSGGRYMTRSVILAAGGASYPMTGSDGSGYQLAKMLGHKIVPPRPALTPIYIENFKLTDLAGLSFPKGKIYHYRNGKKLADYTGDVLITHTGLSGPGILDNSRDMCAGDVVHLKFLYETTSRDALENDMLNGHKKLLKTILMQHMTKRSALKLLQLAEIDENQNCAELGKKARKKLLSYAEAYPMTIKQMGNMKSAMVTAGGVSLKDVKAGTMASKCSEGLFFAGEVLDVDGDSGGYNIQWAFSSGKMAALSVQSYLKEVSYGK